jgi:polar amino acid transport system substrate-binding protein
VARDLGRRVGVPVEFIKFETAGTLGDGVKTGAWDVAFLGAEPQRAAEIAFTAAYLEIPSTYLVPAGSPIRSVADVDREGVRIAVADQSAYGLYLARTIKHAKLVMTKGLDSSFEVFVSQKLEALAGLKPRLLTDVQKLRAPGSWTDSSAVQQAIGTQRTRGSRGSRAFVEEEGLQTVAGRFPGTAPRVSPSFARSAHDATSGRAGRGISTGCPPTS